MKTLPKEYMLELPAYYDEIKIMTHIQTLIDAYGIKTLIQSKRPFPGVVRSGEHETVLKDIFMYMTDTVDYDISRRANDSRFIKDFKKLLFAAGFFG